MEDFAKDSFRKILLKSFEEYMNVEISNAINAIFSKSILFNILDEIIIK